MEPAGLLTEPRLPLRYIGWMAAVAAVLLTGCAEEAPSAPARPAAPQAKALVSTPAFSADSAYAHIAKQVGFGPRVPNSPGHVACGDWIVDRLEQYGADVTVQEARVTAFDGTKLDIRNIFGAFNPAERRRILLLDTANEPRHHQVSCTIPPWWPTRLIIIPTLMRWQWHAPSISMQSRCTWRIFK